MQQKIKKLICAITLIYSFTGIAQQTNWLWVQKGTLMAGNGTADITSITNDEQGNSYLCGWYSGTLTLNTFSAPFSGHPDGFIVKYDKDGDIKWIQNFSNAKRDICFSVKADKSGNTYLGIVAEGLSYSIGTYTLTRPDTKIFTIILKMDATGNILWLKATNGAESVGSELDVNGDNVVVTGYFGLNPLSIDNQTITPIGTKSHVFIAKFNTNGVLQWLKLDGIDANVEPRDVSVNNQGEIFISGVFSGTVSVFGTYTLTGGGQFSYVGFLLKYNANGSLMWAKGFYTQNYSSYGNAVTSDENGHVYLVGYFNGSFVSDTYTLTSNNNYNGFILKFDTNGNTLWAKQEGANLFEEITDASLDNAGNLYVCGNYQSPVLTIGNYTLSNDTNYGSNFSLYTSNFFVAAYTPSGQNIMAKSGGNKFAKDNATCLSVDNWGYIHVAGWFTGLNTTIGAHTITNAISAEKNRRALFYAKIGGPLVSVEENEIKHQQFKLYPNPAIDFLTIDLQTSQNNFANRIYEVILFDNSGKRIREIQMDSEKQINISDLAPGVYLLQLITTGTSVSVQKFIKK